jgi:hypothetical protein
MKHAYILGVALCLSFFVGCAEDPNIGDKTACEASPCSNGGVCSEVGEGFECACPIGFGGLTCELELGDPCDPNPCLNGSTCSAGDAGYACECADGFGGDNCETFEGGPCDPNPCLNGGACSSTADGATICGCLAVPIPAKTVEPALIMATEPRPALAQTVSKVTFATPSLPTILASPTLVKTEESARI